MRAKKKNNSRWKYTDGIILSVFPVVNHRRNMSIGIHVGDGGICSKYFSTLCKIPTDYVHLEIRRL